MAFKLALSAGHGYNTLGKRCDKKLDPTQTREWTLNNRICNKIEDKLTAYTGYELLRVDDRTGKKNVSLTARTNAANKFGANFYLSIHHNAGVNRGKGGGVVAYVYTKVDDETKGWQKDLYNAVVKKTGLVGNRSNPLAASNLAECRQTKMPAVLMECGFMDSATDVPIILTDKFADQVATACVEVIVKRGKLKKKETPKPAATTKPAKKTLEEMAIEVINGDHGNGADRKKKLKALGYTDAEIKEIQNIVNKLL